MAQSVTTTPMFAASTSLVLSSDERKIKIAPSSPHQRPVPIPDRYAWPDFQDCGISRSGAETTVTWESGWDTLAGPGGAGRHGSSAAGAGAPAGGAQSPRGIMPA